MNHWRIIHPQVKIPNYTGTPFDEALHVEKHLDKTKFQAFENETDKLTAVDCSNCRVTIANAKAAFTIYRSLNSADTEQTVFLRPLYIGSNLSLPGCRHEVVDMNEKIFDLVNDCSEESRQVLNELTGFEYGLSLAAQKAYQTWKEKQNIHYSTFLDFIKAKGEIDADCCTDVSELDCAFVVCAGDWDYTYTEQLKKDFKGVFECPVREFPNGIFEFQTNGNEKLHEQISDFINIAAGFCGESTYQKYFFDSQTSTINRLTAQIERLTDLFRELDICVRTHANGKLKKRVMQITQDALKGTPQTHRKPEIQAI